MVLFTFVVMMLNIKVIDISEYRVRYIPLAIIMCSSLLCEIYLMLPVPGPFIKLYSVSMPYTYINWIEQYVYVSNVEAIGLTFYNYYIVIFLLIGIILLMGMLSSISLVFIPSLRIKRQYSYQQMERKIIESIYIAS
jgi:NADH-quinone oxidoreductase subunit J